MHGKDIATEGYKAILKIQNSSREDITTISISVQNEFGNVTKIYVVNKNNNQSKIIVLEMMIAIYIYNIYKCVMSRKCFRSPSFNTIKALTNTILNFKDIHVHIIFINTR